MTLNRNPEKVLRAPNGQVTFPEADRFGHCRLDLTGHDHATSKKLGFAIDALHRWDAFVRSVEKIEGLICYDEQATSPILGGAKDD